MKKIAVSCVAVACAAFWTLPASADEPVARRRAAVAAAPAPAQQATNWTGGQLGSSNGVSSVNNNFVEPGSYNCYLLIAALGSCTETPFSIKDSRAGFITGVYLGYRWQMGMWVVGVEGDANYKFNGKTDGYQSGTPAYLAPGYEEFIGSAKQTWDGSARGRLGFLVNPNALLYVTGGLAFGEVKGSYSYRACEFVTPGCVYGAGSFSDTRVGWTIGGGVEAAIAANWKARVEYRYTDLGNFSANVPLANNYVLACGSFCGSNARIDLGPTNQRFTFGIGFDF